MRDRPLDWCACAQRTLRKLHIRFASAWSWLNRGAMRLDEAYAILLA
jgi:hypothetical protein